MDSLDILLDYIRLVCYGLIFLTSLKGVFNKKFNSILFLGDIIMVVALFFAGLHTNILGRDSRFFADMFLTPAVSIWAVIHFYNLLKRET